MEKEIEIRRAVIDDLDSLHQLHTYWIDKKQIKQVFSPPQLERIIAESDITVAVDDSKVISYYLLNPFFETGNVQKRKVIIKKLIDEGTLKNGKYAYSLQAGTDPDYTGRGINRKVLNLLREFTKDKYDYFIGIMPYGNEATLKSSLKMGWKHYGDVGIGLLAVIETKNNNEHIQVRKAELKDAQGILDINHFWVEKGLKDEKSNGYLREKNSYSILQLEKLISDSLVVVAVDGSKVVSFYFMNPFFNLEMINERERIIQKKIDKGVLRKGIYAFSLLGATDENYLGKGLNSRTLKLLKDLAAPDYDYFIGIMSYDNIATHKSSLKMGWKHYGDVGIGLLAVIGTKD